MTQARRKFREASTPPKAILYPSGTQMSEVPPLARGLSWMEYADTCLAKCPRTFPAPVVAISAGSRRK